MEFRRIKKTENEMAEYNRMRYLLWPKHTEKELYEQMLLILRGENFYKHELSWTVFVAVRENGMLGGFIEITLYPELDFCTSKPVAFIEGWFVDADLRRNGVGKALVETAEEWLKASGIRQIASDVELHNSVSQTAHRALGFAESHRKDGCVFYRKNLS